MCLSLFGAPDIDVISSSLSTHHAIVRREPEYPTAMQSLALALDLSNAFVVSSLIHIPDHRL
jgi:hypothetical protein